MSEMLERAYAAAFADGFMCNEGDIRAALLAAIDPEDEALVEAVTDVLSQYDDAMITTADHPGAARAAIALLRQLAQGEQS